MGIVLRAIVVGMVVVGVCVPLITHTYFLHSGTSCPLINYPAVAVSECKVATERRGRVAVGYAEVRGGHRQRVIFLS